MIVDILAFVRVLSDAGVDYVVIAGVAANIHGSARTTVDIDVVYGRSAANIERLAVALSPYHPYLRGAPPGLPFAFDAATIGRGLNFILETSLGDIDFLGEVAGGGTFEQLLPHAEVVDLESRRCLVVGLEKLIALKRAAGRPKDREVLAELEALLEERGSEPT